MPKSNNFVHILVDKNFFNNTFEPARRKLETRFNKRISQPKFTEFIYRSGGKLWIPKAKKVKSQKQMGKEWGFNLTI